MIRNLLVPILTLVLNVMEVCADEARNKFLASVKFALESADKSKIEKLHYFGDCPKAEREGQIMALVKNYSGALKSADLKLMVDTDFKHKKEWKIKGEYGIIHYSVVPLGLIKIKGGSPGIKFESALTFAKHDGKYVLVVSWLEKTGGEYDD